MFAQEVLDLLKQYGLTRRDLAKITGISYQPLCFYLRQKGKGATIAERLIPFIYGDKRDQLLKNGGAQNVR